MNAEELKIRTKKFALDVACLCADIPHVSEATHARGQLQRCSSSVAANYRAACRGKSKPDFIAKLGIVEEEADESVFWLEFLSDLNFLRNLKFEAQMCSELDRLQDEASQLLAITVSSRKTARGNGRSFNRKSTLANRKLIRLLPSAPAKPHEETHDQNLEIGTRKSQIDMDLPKHLSILHEKLAHPTDYELAFCYFLQEFGGDMGLHSEGTPNDAPHLRTALSAVISKATGQLMNPEQFVCSFLHGHNFFHGHASTTENTIVFFYFAKANLGLATIISFAGGTQQVARFQLPKSVPGNPGYN